MLWSCWTQESNLLVCLCMVDRFHGSVTSISSITGGSSNGSDNNTLAFLLSAFSVVVITFSVVAGCTYSDCGSHRPAMINKYVGYFKIIFRCICTLNHGFLWEVLLVCLIWFCCKLTCFFCTRWPTVQHWSLTQH